MIEELFYPKELKEIIADLRAKNDLNEKPLKALNFGETAMPPATSYKKAASSSPTKKIIIFYSVSASTFHKTNKTS